MATRPNPLLSQCLHIYKSSTWSRSSVPSVLYRLYHNEQAPTVVARQEQQQQTFLTKEEIDHILRKHEQSYKFTDGSISMYEWNQLAANDPCEDELAAAQCIQTDAYLFGIFDGHAGGQCSQAVARRLFDFVAASLLPHELKVKMTHGPAQHLMSTSCGETEALLKWIDCSSAYPECDLMQASKVHKFLRSMANSHSAEKQSGTVRDAVQKAFAFLDDALGHEALPDTHGMVNPNAVFTVASGSCACVAHIRGANLHVANAGDSSAVLGVCTQSGSWHARTLTHDHCIDNPLEVRRIRGEHPQLEADQVLKGGRLLGQLFPLRAFGDIRYKWSRELQKVVLVPMLGANVIPPGLDTPPYLTAVPEVYYHRLTPQDRFLVIASDGLWEQLTPDRVIRFVSDHLIGKETLSPFVALPNTKLGSILDDLRTRKAGELKRPLDANCATHLIRHAIGGSSARNQYKNLNDALTVPPGPARDYRDDITLQIIYFDQPYLNKHTPAVS